MQAVIAVAVKLRYPAVVGGLQLEERAAVGMVLEGITTTAAVGEMTLLSHLRGGSSTQGGCR